MTNPNVEMSQIKAEPPINGHMSAEEQADDDLLKRIESLESQLAAAKAKLQSVSTAAAALPKSNKLNTTSTNLHLWLLLADSALPIGSFAFSSGLESYTSHRSLRHPLSSSSSSGQKKPTPRSDLSRFLRLSLLSISTTTIPFVTAAFQTPSSAPQLDETFDATTTCEVARRASISQGRALCSVWDKSFAQSLLPTAPQNPPTPNTNVEEEVVVEVEISEEEPYETNFPKTHRPDHFGVSWGYITALSNLPRTNHSLHQVLSVFLFNHVKAVLSAAVRLSLIGPYVAQQMLASEEVRGLVAEAVERGRGIPVTEAGQSVPTVDLWQGRHERLYTRIFNS
ncbi:hypothetical protein AA313_de0203335 [Arthrobotrys entomopaga]|nr:hypothetical protein AA313_de0203335 [Arthrobotrys entomopaga]